MMPIVDGLEEEFDAQITVQRLNAAETDNLQLMQEYGGRGHPFFVFLDENGRVTQTFFGPQDEETLRSTIQPILP